MAERRLRPWVLVAVILVAALAVSASVLAFFSFATANVQNSAVDATNTSAQVEVHDLANILASKIQAITNNLVILSASPGVQSLNATIIDSLLREAQNTTASYSTSYGFSDAAGMPVASSNLTSLEVSIDKGVNNGRQPWFLGAKKSGSVFADPEYFSVTLNKTIIVLAKSVYSHETVNGSVGKRFVGVIAGGVSFRDLGALVRSQLAPEAQGTLGVVTDNGTILYGNSAQGIGMNLFDPSLEAQVPQSLKAEFYGFINASLSGIPALHDFTYNGVTGALASQPIFYSDILGNQSSYGVFAVVYVSAPGVLAISQVTQIYQLRTFTTFAILGIMIVASGSSLLILRRNRSLSLLVKERTEDLERSLRTSQLLQDILTHDIRNYNQITASNAEILEEELTDSKSKRFVEAIQKSAEGSTELIQKTRLLASLASGEAKNLTEVSVKESLERSITLVKGAFPDKTLVLTLPDMKDAKVLADPLLDQVFVNVISNAVKYTDGPRVPIQIDVKAVAENGSRMYWNISIEDQGRGIPDEMKTSATMRYLGTAKGRGLGLSIARALVVDRYSGRFELENRVEEDYAKGTRVEIWIPTK
jgi:signal transduction histidine kinase